MEGMFVETESDIHNSIDSQLLDAGNFLVFDMFTKLIAGKKRK